MKTETALIPVKDLQVMAGAMAKSGLFSLKQDQALALMFVAQAEGTHPATAVMRYHVVQGRPAKKAETMLADFQSAGGSIEWHSLGYDGKAEATFSHPQGGKNRVAFTLDDAKRAGLTGKQVWKQYPDAMLRARVISAGVRLTFPAVLAGLYTPEEVESFSTPQRSEPEQVDGEVVEDAPAYEPDRMPAAIENIVALGKILKMAAKERGENPADFLAELTGGRFTTLKGITYQDEIDDIEQAFNEAAQARMEETVA